MIHIFYRHYNVTGRETWRPEWFDYEKCFLNLIDTIKDLKNVKLIVVFDGDDKENFINKYDVDIRYICAGSDYESFKKTIDIVKNENIDDEDIIYLLENDYLHLDGWVFKVLDFFKYKNNDYLSLYDHSDKYFESYKTLESKLIVVNDNHYRTTPSTCGSFLVKKKVLFDDLEYHYDGPIIFSKFTNMPVDHTKFLLLKFFKNRDTYSPVPAMSTHCLVDFLSPTIKWDQIIKKYDNE
jgi:hypothetical protein